MPAATATLTSAPVPGATVWCIKTACGVEEGTLVQVRAVALITGTTYYFDVNLSGGTTTFAPADVFTTLHDAIVEYETRLS